MDIGGHGRRERGEREQTDAADDTHCASVLNVRPAPKQR